MMDSAADDLMIASIGRSPRNDPAGGSDPPGSSSGAQADLDGLPLDHATKLASTEAQLRHRSARPRIPPNPMFPFYQGVPTYFILLIWRGAACTHPSLGHGAEHDASSSEEGGHTSTTMVRYSSREADRCIRATTTPTAWRRGWRIPAPCTRNCSRGGECPCVALSTVKHLLQGDRCQSPYVHMYVSHISFGWDWGAVRPACTTAGT